MARKQLNFSNKLIKETHNYLAMQLIHEVTQKVQLTSSILCSIFISLSSCIDLGCRVRGIQVHKHCKKKTLQNEEFARIFVALKNSYLMFVYVPQTAGTEKRKMVGRFQKLQKERS